MLRNIFKESWSEFLFEGLGHGDDDVLSRNPQGKTVGVGEKIPFECFRFDFQFRYQGGIVCEGENFLAFGQTGFFDGGGDFPNVEPLGDGQEPYRDAAIDEG